MAAGAVIALTGITEAESLKKLINALPKKALIEANLKALEAGREAVAALEKQTVGV